MPFLAKTATQNPGSLPRPQAPRQLRTRSRRGMSGFRKPELSRDQIVLWSQRLEDAIPLDHPVRLFEQWLHAEPLAATL